MRLILLLLIFSLPAEIKSQQAQGLLVEYDYKFVINDINKAFLVGNSHRAYFFYSRNRELAYEKLIESTNGSAINPYFLYKYDYANNLIYQPIGYMALQGKKFEGDISADSISDLRWNIEAEHKEILGYRCIKAVTVFRGRKYTVWFAPDIPTTVFPWKLNGTPGLILEFADDQNFIKGAATRLILNKDFTVPAGIKSKFGTDLTTSVPYRRVIEEENRYLIEKLNQQVAALPAGTAYQLPDSRAFTAEKSFEWE